MPAADTTYIIGVIREREKNFLAADDYARLNGAASASEAVRVIAETAYGKYVGDKRDMISAWQALDTHLAEVHAWLGDAVLDKRIWQFVSSRYDALNMARALVALARGDEVPEDLSPLSSIAPEVLQSCLWHNLGWEKMPAMWAEFAQATREQKLPSLAIGQRVAKREEKWRTKLAVTSLLREINQLKLDRRRAEEARPFGVEVDASEFERDWDERLMQEVRKYRLEPTGYDAIVAYWYGQELEVKQLRLLLAAKLNQLPPKRVASLQRSQYRTL